jgi:hypothetical protein
MSDYRAHSTSELIYELVHDGLLSSKTRAVRNELDARIPPRDRPMTTSPRIAHAALTADFTPHSPPVAEPPTTSPAALHSLTREALVDQLIVMARRACREMPGKQMRLDFEADLAALLREHGREP